MKQSSLLVVALLFLVWGSLEAKADTNLNFYFGGMLGGSSEPAATPVPVQEEEEELTCPSPTPAVCPAVATFNYCEEPEVEDYFAMDTSVRPHQIKAEYFGIYRPEGDEAVKEYEGVGHHKRGAIAGCQAPMTYLGGPVMDGRNEVYFIYYGAFSSFHPNGTNAATNKTKSLMAQFVSSVSNSPWFNITTEYFSR
jgi:hypothetical protein